jgi:PEGA domain
MSLIRFRLAQLFPIAGLVTLLAFTGCASSTVLQSQPPGARVFLNNVPVGTTPYTMTDANIVGTTTQVRLEYPGYQPLNTYIVRNEELDPLALIGGCFLLVPFLWVMKYSASHFYQLQPGGGPPAGWGAPQDQGGYPPPQGAYPPGPAGYPPPPPGYPPPAGDQQGAPQPPPAQ